MFDRYEISTSPSDVHINVTEKRAPTDESVRLLREMEEKIQKKLLASVRVEDTKFNCVIHMQQEVSSNQFMFCAVFSLNGEKLKVVYRCDVFSANVDDAIIGLRDAVAVEIANHIASAFTSDHVRQFRGSFQNKIF